MTVFYLSSVSPSGTTITTRHYDRNAASTESLRRSLANHTNISIQETNLHPNGVETCTKRKSVRPRPLGGRHA